MLDMVTVKRWMPYRRDANNFHLPKSEISQLATFKLRVAIALTKSGKPVGVLKRGRPPSAEASAKTKRVERPTQAWPEAPVRSDNIGHWPKVEDKKKGCSGKTNILCMRCKVDLCLNNHNNCFVEFHTG